MKEKTENKTKTTHDAVTAIMGFIGVHRVDKNLTDEQLAESIGYVINLVKDTHAEQVAVGFAEFCSGFSYYDDSIWKDDNGITYTTAELLNLFTTKKEEDADK